MRLASELILPVEVTRPCRQSYSGIPYATSAGTVYYVFGPDTLESVLFYAVPLPCPSIPSNLACSAAPRQASAEVNPSARIRFSPLVPETTQTRRPPTAWNAVSASDQPTR